MDDPRRPRGGDAITFVPFHPARCASMVGTLSALAPIAAQVSVASSRHRDDMPRRHNALDRRRRGVDRHRAQNARGFAYAEPSRRVIVAASSRVESRRAGGRWTGATVKPLRGHLKKAEGGRSRGRAARTRVGGWLFDVWTESIGSWSSSHLGESGSHAARRHAAADCRGRAPTRGRGAGGMKRAQTRSSGRPDLAPTPLAPTWTGQVNTTPGQHNAMSDSKNLPGLSKTPRLQSRCSGRPRPTGSPAAVSVDV